MLVAIHPREGSFSDRWIAYCAEHGIPHKVVNAYDSDILAHLRGADVFLWHWSHGAPHDLMMARHVITAAEMMGLKVFPNTATCWHFDDKIAQKYLLEAVGAPLVPTYVFYDREAALRWTRTTTFPKVFKLRRGAGAINVRLASSAAEAQHLIHRAFGKGFKASAGYLANADVRYRRAVRNRDLLGALKRLPRTLLSIRRESRFMSRERGYAYFQEFIPGNTFDTRITVIGERAFGFTRDVRPNDFRASGSGRIDYDLARIDPRCVTTAFDIARRIVAQSVAFDFLTGPEGPCITEISFGYQAKAVYDCPGQWDRGRQWHEGHLWPEHAILEDLLTQAASK
jgi:glutathione synthase/RimK-type ligase-like ATP-grasp enzyme